MVKYTHLNRDPGKAMEDLVKKLSASSKGQKTKPTGVKDLGDAGDVVWTREDGSEQSARLIDVDLEAARAAVSELRDVTMPALAEDLSDARTDLQQKLDAANARIDDIIVDGGGAGNFTTYSINEPSGDGTGEGDQWFRVVNGEVIGQWRWDGAAWVPVTLTDAIIAGIDLSKLTGNGGLSEVVANKMFADIFTANKITSQEIAAGSITTEKIAAEGIVADVIQGGAFTGESFTGGTFTGGLFKTSDSLPGQVEFADDAYMPSWGAVGQTYPGLRVNPIDASTTSVPAGIGSYGDGVIVDGGKATTGQSSYIVSNPRTSYMRTYREDGTEGGVISSSSGASVMRTYREDGTTGGLVLVSPTDSRMRTYSGDSSESGWVRVRPKDAELAYVDSSNTYVARIYAGETQAYLSRGRSRIAVEGNSLQVSTRYGGGAGGVIDADADGVTVRRVNASNIAVCGLDTKNNATRIYGSDGTYTRGSVEVGSSGIVAGSGYGTGFTMFSSATRFTGRTEFQDAVAIEGNNSVLGRFYNNGAGTHSRSANVTMPTSGGLISVSTSSRRYKKNIVDWNPDPERVLAMRPRQWQHADPRSEIDETWRVGFVAEEIDDLGLKGLVEYAGDGKGGWRPDGLNYDRFAAAQQVVLQKHEAEVKELQAENAALRDRLDALTARLDAAGI